MGGGIHIQALRKHYLTQGLNSSVSNFVLHLGKCKSGGQMLRYIILKMTEMWDIWGNMRPHTVEQWIGGIIFKHGIAHLSMTYYWLNYSLNIEHATKLISWGALIQLGRALCMWEESETCLHPEYMWVRSKNKLAPLQTLLMSHQLSS